MAMQEGNGSSNGFSPVGSSISMDLWGVTFETLNAPFFLSDIAKQAAEKAGMRVLDINITPFQPQGLSLVLILAESHLAIHTSPEHGYIAIDIFTCGKGNPLLAAKDLCGVLKPKEVSFREFRRGVRPESQGERIQRNFQSRKIEYA